MKKCVNGAGTNSGTEESPETEPRLIENFEMPLFFPVNGFLVFLRLKNHSQRRVSRELVISTFPKVIKLL